MYAHKYAFDKNKGGKALFKQSLASNTNITANIMAFWYKLLHLVEAVSGRSVRSNLVAKISAILYITICTVVVFAGAWDASSG